MTSNIDKRQNYKHFLYFLDYQYSDARVKVGDSSIYSTSTSIGLFT